MVNELKQPNFKNGILCCSAWLSNSDTFISYEGDLVSTPADEMNRREFALGVLRLSPVVCLSALMDNSE